MRSDVARAQRAENRVADRVQQRIGVGIAREPPLVGNRHAAQHEAAPRDECVDIEAIADAHRWRRHVRLRL